MLSNYLTVNQRELLDRCESKIWQRHSSSPAVGEDLARGLPLLLDALMNALAEPQQDQGSPLGPEAAAKLQRINASPETLGAAARHGHELFRQGFPVEEIAYSYGDLCQAIMDLALEHDAPIGLAEFRTLNHGLDAAIAGALKQYARLHDSSAAEAAARASRERLGMLAHELRNYLHTATLALSAIRADDVGPAAGTLGVLDRSLLAMTKLINRSLGEVRARAAFPVRHMAIDVGSFIEDVQAAASLEAAVSGCSLNVSPVDPMLAVWADHDLLWSAVGNLLQNAFKFSPSGTAVSLHAYSSGERVLIEVADNCGGLPAGAMERLFQPFAQSGADKCGVGLGLSICRHSVEANHGALRVRDIPGSGCIFTIDLPRHASPRTGT